MDYDKLGGSLLETEGKVTRVALGADGAIEEFWLKDDTGVEAAIFIDGYIKSATTGKNELVDFVKVGATVSAAGVLYKHPEGDSDVSVPVFRVRNCDDIKLVKESEPEIKPQPQPEPEKKPEIVEKIEKVVKEVIVPVVKQVAKAIAENPVVKEIYNAIKGFFGRIFKW